MSAYYQNKYNMPGVKVIKNPSLRSSGFVFTKYSPLTPFFRQFGIKSFNNGLYQKLISKWFGKTVPAFRPNEKIGLSYR